MHYNPLLSCITTLAFLFVYLRQSKSLQGLATDVAFRQELVLFHTGIFHAHVYLCLHPLHSQHMYANIMS